MDNRGVKPTTKIQISINAEPVMARAESTVADLIRELQLDEKRLAVELNLSILPRAKWSETILESGDKLEIVHFVGGG
jgi:thiamine biosynthesis protein ThiS